MADHTKIEWTDATWSPITGCSVTSPGCKHCYAMQLAGTRLKHHESRAGLTLDTSAGPVWTGEVRFNSQWLDQPLRWKKPRKIFVCAHSDLFHESVPDEWIDKVFAVMALARRHIFQVLTKRAKRMREYFSALTRDRIEEAAREMGYTFRHSGAWMLALPLPNVWLGVSVEDQKRANERMPDLIMTPAAVRWVSAEPLLENIHIASWLYFVDWVVVGGESGPKARPMHPQWARDLRDQCAEAGVPFLFKQWGEWHTAAFLTSTGAAVFRQFDNFDHWVAKAKTWVNGGICLDRHGREMKIGADMARAQKEGSFPVTIMHRVGKKAAGRLLDGVLHDGYPEVKP